VAQVGVSLALLIVAGLFVRSLTIAQHADLGFDPDHVLNVRLDPGEIGYTQARTKQFYEQLLVRTRALPGVQSATLATTVPLGDSEQTDEITIPGYAPARGEDLHVIYNSVATDYFETMKIALLKGRDFSSSDSESSSHVAVINQAMADRFWPHSNAIGSTFLRRDDPQHAIQIVGVVRNSRTEDVYSPYTASFYVPISQTDSSARTLQVRTVGAPAALASDLQALVRSIAPSEPILSLRTMREQVNSGAGGFLFFNLGAELTGALGIMGLALALVGIYGVMAYAVGQRTQEIGVRMALGAERTDILWMVSRQGLAMVGTGLVLGLLLAMGVGRLVQNFLVGIGPTDFVTYLEVSSLLLISALTACYIPARRATKVDPMVALRYE
jgi:predicted permease